MKRKTDASQQSNGAHETKKRALSDDAVISHFRNSLFKPIKLNNYIKAYTILTL